MTEFKMKRRVVSTSVLLIMSVMTGCVNLASVYKQPQLPVDEHYSLPDAYKERFSIDDDSLYLDSGPTSSRSVFEDVRLQKVIALALDNNRDLRTATLNMVKARAEYGIEDSATYPNLNASTSSSASRVPGDLTGTGLSQINRQYAVSLGTTSYEFDFFGRVKNLKSTALEQFYASEQAGQTVLISLVADVANTWFNWYADVDLLNVQQALLKSQTDTLTLIKQRFELGAVAEVDVHQQHVAVAQAQVEVERLIAQTQRDRNALTLLIGTTLPEQLAPTGQEQSLTIYTQDMLAKIPVGLPSDLMLRRPDILEKEHKLKAANANIGVARAAFYPRISLTANAGLSSAALSGLFESGSGAWTFAPQISLPIFDGGANKSNLKIAQADRDIAVSEYEKSIQTAFREVSDALVNRASISKQLEAQRALVTASGKAYELTQARYERGIDNWLDVLNAQQAYISAHSALIQLSAQQLTNGVTLYKALGGGWDDGKHTSSAVVDG